MKTPNGKYSCKNGYLQIVIHRGRASACGEKFTVMTACNTFGKRPCGWGAQKPCVIRAEARIDFTSLTRSVFTCSKRLLFEQPYYRKFTVTCGCNPCSVVPASLDALVPWFPLHPCVSSSQIPRRNYLPVLALPRHFSAQAIPSHGRSMVLARVLAPSTCAALASTMLLPYDLPAWAEKGRYQLMPRS